MILEFVIFVEDDIKFELVINLKYYIILEVCMRLN